MTTDEPTPQCVMPLGRPSPSLAKQAQKAHAAMRAAIDVGAYLTAEEIRRHAMLFVCSICGTSRPKKNNIRYSVTNGNAALIDIHAGQQWATVKFGRVLNHDKNISLLCCTGCVTLRVCRNVMHYYQSSAQHRCHQITGPDGYMRSARWLCEVV